MRTWIAGGLGLMAAFGFFSLLRPLGFPPGIAADVFAVTVLLFGTLRGEIPGAVLGAACGLIVDAFSLGVFGLAGLSLTTGGFLAGLISRKINILPWPRTLLFFFVLAAGLFLVWTGLSFLVEPNPIAWNLSRIILHPAAAAVGATILHEGIRRLKARHD